MGPRLWMGLLAGGLLLACDDTTIVQRTAILQLTPEEADFGVVEITQQRVETFALRNIEPVFAELAEVRVDDDCGGCFLLLDSPTVVEANERLDLRVRYRASALGPQTGTLTVVGLNPEVTLTAELRGEGTDTRRPDVAVTPAAVEFGFVPAGGVAVGSFSVRSVGSLDLIVDRVTLDPPDAPFVITTSTPTPAAPGVLAPGVSASVGLRAVLPASDTSTRTARILIETNVLEEKNVPGRPGVVAVPLSARGNLPPVAVVGDDLVVEPFSQVQLDGSRSYDQDDPPDLPLTFAWTLVTAPGGSTAELLRARTARPVFRPDLSGRYEVELVVADGLGLESEPARQVIEAFPDEAIRIELIWDHPDSDLDLHLIREGGTFCDCTSSVHYRDCARQADWFPEAPGANPELDRDERRGFGPETILFRGDGANKFIPPGRFTLAVHYFATNERVSSWPTTTSNATVRVFVFGLLAAEATRAMQVEREVWVVGDLTWPEASLQLDGQVIPNAACGVF